MNKHDGFQDQREYHFRKTPENDNPDACQAPPPSALSCIGSRTGTTMATKKTGKRGLRGRTGARGPTGPAGPKVQREEILAVVDDEFVQVRKNFKTQLTNSTRIQKQLDEIHGLLKKLIEQSSYAR